MIKVTTMGNVRRLIDFYESLSVRSIRGAESTPQRNCGKNAQSYLKCNDVAVSPMIEVEVVQNVDMSVENNYRVIDNEESGYYGVISMDSIDLHDQYSDPGHIGCNVENADIFNLHIQPIKKTDMDKRYKIRKKESAIIW